MLKFLTSNHTRAYLAIGFKFHVWPERVYALAHGTRTVSCEKDRNIQLELLEQGIIHRHRRGHSKQ